MFISNLEISLLQRMSNDIIKDSPSELINKEDILNAIQEIQDRNSEGTRFEFCSALETAFYCFSIILSDVRSNRRAVMSALFEENPKLAQEKSTLKEKLDAEPEYAQVHKLEEQLFQIVEHITNIKNNVTYLLKDEEE